jgi:hypothetical protein
MIIYFYKIRENFFRPEPVLDLTADRVAPFWTESGKLTEISIFQVLLLITYRRERKNT